MAQLNQKDFVIVTPAQSEPTRKKLNPCFYVAIIFCLVIGGLFRIMFLINGHQRTFSLPTYEIVTYKYYTFSRNE